MPDTWRAGTAAALALGLAIWFILIGISVVIWDSKTGLTALFVLWLSFWAGWAACLGYLTWCARLNKVIHELEDAQRRVDALRRDARE